MFAGRKELTSSNRFVVNILSSNTLLGIDLITNKSVHNISFIIHNTRVFFFRGIEWKTDLRTLMPIIGKIDKKTRGKQTTSYGRGRSWICGLAWSSNWYLWSAIGNWTEPENDDDRALLLFICKTTTQHTCSKLYVCARYWLCKCPCALVCVRVWMTWFYLANSVARGFVLQFHWEK